jgi:hypothetical protein
MIVVPYPPYFSPIPRLKINVKVCHFDTIEVIGAESQAVPEHPHRTGLPELNYKMAEELGTVHTRGKGLLQGRW